MEAGRIKKMNIILKTLIVSIFFIPAIFPGVCLGITAGALKGMMDRGEKITIVDIRSLESFREGHIYGAINIPAGIIARKPLPPIGRVIVCGNDLHRDTILKSVDDLTAKTGIQAEMLEGGFAAWEALKLPRTRKRGLKSEHFHYITYQQLKNASAINHDIVLVDLRSSSEEEKQVSSEMTSNSIQELTDLPDKFPGLKVITPSNKDGKFSSAVLSGIVQSGNSRIHILIDMGDGKAEKTARRLKAAGRNQVSILTGGERTLQMDGQPVTKILETGN